MSLLNLYILKNDFAKFESVWDVEYSPRVCIILRRRKQFTSFTYLFLFV